MDREALFRNALSKWMDGTGPGAELALSSRVRLARNVEGIPFSHMMNEEQAQRVLGLAQSGVDELNRFGFLGRVDFIPMAELQPLERQVLVEKHLISPQQAEEPLHKAVAISEDESTSILVNEEDHFRVQCLTSGLQLEQAWQTASRVDDALESRVTFAFSERRGYLTACPTNVGTGVRVSVMMHLPALVITNQAGRVFHSATQLGLAVRGLYGEGTEAIGNIFQVSNQITLGRGEEEIVGHLKAVSAQIIEQERQARSALLAEARERLEDRICRSYGVLQNARIINSEEAMRLLSDVRLGSDVGIIKNVSLKTLNELLVLTQPGFLQRRAGLALGPGDRDLRRAAVIRQRLAGGTTAREK